MIILTETRNNDHLKRFISKSRSFCLIQPKFHPLYTGPTIAQVPSLTFDCDKQGSRPQQSRSRVWSMQTDVKLSNQTLSRDTSHHKSFEQPYQHLNVISHFLLIYEIINESINESSVSRTAHPPLKSQYYPLASAFYMFSRPYYLKLFLLCYVIDANALCENTNGQLAIIELNESG